MDLVAGATGKVGARAALRLKDRGREVRALVRGGAGRPEAAPLTAAGIEVVDGDLARPESLKPAVEGVETVICTATAMSQAPGDDLRRVDRDGVMALMEASERAGAQRFVYASLSSRFLADSPLVEAKRACEERLQSSRMEGVSLRPSYFMESWLHPAAGFDPAARRVRFYGTGEAPVSYVSLFDVAEFAVEAATRPERPEPVLELGGPAALSLREVVGIFEEAVGASFEREEIPLAALEERHRAARDPAEKTLAALALDYARGAQTPEAADVADRFGIRLRTVPEYVWEWH